MKTQVYDISDSPGSKTFDRLQDRYRKWAEMEPQQCWQDEQGQWCTYIGDGNTSLTVSLDTLPSVHSDMRLSESIWQFTTGKNWLMTVYNRERSRDDAPLRYTATIVALGLYFPGSGESKGEAALDAYCKALQKLKELNS